MARVRMKPKTAMAKAPSGPLISCRAELAPWTRIGAELRSNNQPRHWLSAFVAKCSRLQAPARVRRQVWPTTAVDVAIL